MRVQDAGRDRAMADTPAVVAGTSALHEKGLPGRSAGEAFGAATSFRGTGEHRRCAASTYFDVDVLPASLEPALGSAPGPAVAGVPGVPFEPGSVTVCGER